MSSESVPRTYLGVVEKFAAERDERQEHFSLKTPESLDFPEVVELFEQVGELTGSWNPVEIYTASNYAAEKTKFIASFLETGETANPQFEYAVADGLDLAESREKLFALRTQAKNLARETRSGKAMATEEDRLKYYAAVLAILKIEDDLATCDMVDGIKSRDDEKTKRALTKKYGALDPSLVAAADEIYQGKLRPESPGGVDKEEALLSQDEQNWLLSQEFDAETTKGVFEWALDKYGFLAKEDNNFGFRVEVSDSATSIDVRDKNQARESTIVIPKDRVVNGKQLLSLIGHEIESHARQSMNGAKLFGLGGGALKIDGEAPYEGLAKQADIRFEKEYFGKETAAPEPYYIKAIELAGSGKSFGEVFKEIAEMKRRAGKMTDEKLANSAWLTTYRVFRGSTDPENTAAYAMPKDKAYLEGYLISEQLEELGYGEYNQLAITTGAGLRLLGMFDVAKQDIPYPNLDLQREFWEEALRPEFEKSQGR